MGSEKWWKTFFKVLERQNLQNQRVFDNAIMIINQNILAILKAFSNFQKIKVWKTNS